MLVQVTVACCSSHVLSSTAVRQAGRLPAACHNTTPLPAAADERLHAAFHASALEGPRYQGWQGEKVAQLDGSRGRVLLFSSADMQGRGRKVCGGSTCCAASRSCWVGGG